MIEVQGLTKKYGDRLAIDDLSFEVKKGEIVGFLGPNGAGKTTTMKILTGFMAPTSGEVKIGGVDIFEDPIQAKQKLGYLSETPPLYMDMKVEDYLAYVAKLRKVKRESLSERLDEVLGDLELQEVKKRLIGNLSKGFRQRVGVAQALVSDPEVLVLDEPTVGLDPTQVAHFRELLGKLKGKHTIILSTHILSEVQASCERVIIIKSGKIIAQDSLAHLSQKTTGGVRRVTFKVRRPKKDFLVKFEAFDFVKMATFAGDELHVDLNGGEDFLEEASSRIVESGMGLLGMEVSKEKLEDIFLELTSEKS